MKSDRRHELQHNQLADALGASLEKLKPYTRLIGGLVVLLVVLGAAYAYVSNKNEARAVAGWDEYFQAVNDRDRAALVDIAEKYPGSSVALWARIVAADMALNEGSFALFNNKAEGRDLLRQAVNGYQTVLNTAKEDEFKQRALFGLGRAHESLGTLDDLNRARDDYSQLIDKWPEGVYASAAKQRLDNLDRASTKQFYDWFAKYEPPARTSPSGKKPDFLEESLDKDIDLPSALDELKLDGPSTTPGADTIEFPDLGVPDTKSGDKPSDDADKSGDQDAPAKDAAAEDAASGEAASEGEDAASDNEEPATDAKAKDADSSDPEPADEPSEK